MKPMKVGVAGVGLMGLGIATNILKSGHKLAFLDHPGNQDTGGLIAGGARSFESAAELAAASDIIVLCVTGSPQVEDVLTRHDGVLSGLGKGKVIIDCSTAIPGSTKRMAAKVSEAGGRFLDAPMTRTPKEAMEGRLNLIVGGDADLFAEMKPLLECFAENISHVGDVGAGHAMKLIHNFVSLGQIAVVSEAAATAAEAGIDPSVLVDVLAKGGGGGVALDRMTPFILKGDVGALRFSIANALKDIGYYNEFAGESATMRETARGILAMLEHAVAAGDGARFVPELAELNRKPGAK